MNPGLSSTGRIALAIAVLFTAFAVISMGTAPVASAAGGQPACAKFKKKIRKAKTGAKKRLAKLQVKQCKADTMVRNRIGNSYFVGTRSDGVGFDTIYCRNGKVQDSPGSRPPWKNGWRVENARVRSPKNFTAILYTPIKGGSFVQSVAFKNGQWQIGYEFGDQPQALGDAVRTDASKQCRQL